MAPKGFSILWGTGGDPLYQLFTACICFLFATQPDTAWGISWGKNENGGHTTPEVLVSFSRFYVSGADDVAHMPRIVELFYVYVDGGVAERFGERGYCIKMTAVKG
eukprot:scaffold3999_cov138-Skeletonema_dohrnii-CCMP3373.AAC.2